MFPCSHRTRPRIITCNFYAASNILQSLHIKAWVGNATSARSALDQNGAGGEKQWVVGWGKAAASAGWMLPVVTKGIITEVITGWAQLSHVQAQCWSLEGQGELAGSLLGYQSREISKACTETPSANPGAREQEQNSWPGTEQLEADPSQPPIPSCCSAPGEP